MTEIERKALTLVNEAFLEHHYEEWSRVPQGCVSKALIRAIEQHEAFRQEVSDYLTRYYEGAVPALLRRFIIAKPDPLVEAVKACDLATLDGIEDAVAHDLRTALAARGLKIVEDK